MKEVRGVCPLEMVLTMVPAWRLQRRINEAAELAERDRELRRKLLAWVESLTENNCGWIEYDVAKEVASRLRARGVDAWTGKTGNQSDQPPYKIPVEFAADFRSLPEAIHEGIWEIVKAGLGDRRFLLKMLRLAKPMRHSNWWAVRWTADRIQTKVKAWLR